MTKRTHWHLQYGGNKPDIDGMSIIEEHWSTIGWLLQGAANLKLRCKMDISTWLSIIPQQVLSAL